MGAGAGQESWAPTVKDPKGHAKELELDSAGIWEPLS